MPQDYIPNADADFLTFGTTLAQTLTANPTTYGITAAQATAVTNAVNQVGQALQDVNALKAELASAVDQKDALRTSAEQTIRSLARQIQANPGVTDDQKSQAGLPVYDTTPTSSAPNAPTDLVVKANASGMHELSWKRNGNPSGTSFIIECRKGNETNWSFVKVVQRTRYEHTGNTPGQMVVYRVRAQRGEQESLNSDEVVAYLV